MTIIQIINYRIGVWENTQKNHYLPESLLRLFTFYKDSIWQFSKSKLDIKRKNVAKSAYVRNLYKIDVDENDATDPLFFEKTTSQIEDHSIEIIKNISKNNYKITIDNKEILTLYMILLHTRTPAAKDEMSLQAEAFALPAFKAVLETQGKYSKEEIDLMINSSTIGLTNNGHVGYISGIIKEHFHYYKLKHWTFASCNNDTSFIIGDNPCILYVHPTNIHKGGLAQQGSFLYCPLRSDLAIFMGDYIELSCSHITLTKDEVRQLNIDMMSRSREYCYGQSDKQLFYLQKKASLESYSIKNKIKVTTHKTDKENEELLWQRIENATYLHNPIRQKIERQIMVDTEESFLSPKIIIPQL